jgi:hypothetical protein
MGRRYYWPVQLNDTQFIGANNYHFDLVGRNVTVVGY